MEADTVTSILPCVDEVEKFSAMPLEPDSNDSSAADCCGTGKIQSTVSTLYRAVNINFTSGDSEVTVGVKTVSASVDGLAFLR